MVALAAMRAESLGAQTEDREKAVKVKAAYLLNFTKFVTWPKETFESDTSPMVIGVVGVDPFGSVLDQTIKDKTVAGRGFKIERYRWRAGESVSAISKCHLLYISPSMCRDAADLIVALAREPILFVGEGAEFAKIGGTLGFMLEEDRIVFWASKEAASAARLELSSQLLKLARPMEDGVAAQSEAAKDTKRD